MDDEDLLDDAPEDFSIEAPALEEGKKSFKYHCRGPGCEHGADERWRGRCPGCGKYYNCELKKRHGEAEEENTAAALSLMKPKVHIPTGIEELDFVLCGGLVAGSLVMLGGSKGTGKTTTAIQVGENWAQRGKKVLVASGEQNKTDIADIFLRVGASSSNLSTMTNEGDIKKIVERARSLRASLIVIDSLQKMYIEDVDGAAGSVAQIDASLMWITSYCKPRKVACIIICHVNKQGEFAGSERSLHDVDTLLYMAKRVRYDDDGVAIDGTEGLIEIMIDEKNRDGRVDLTSMMQMMPDGSGVKSLSFETRKKLSKLSFGESKKPRLTLVEE